MFSKLDKFFYLFKLTKHLKNYKKMNLKLWIEILLKKGTEIKNLGLFKKLYNLFKKK
jgi:hypothetical protein